MKHKIPFPLLIIAFLLLGLLTVIIAQQFLFSASTPKRMSAAIAEKLPAGDFSLKSADGAVSLSDFKGKVVLLYFGYTACPDICPTSLTHMGKAIDQLNDNEKQHVQGIFVSIDPERDSLQRLKEYSQHFNQKIMGLTGTKTEVDQIVKRYSVAYEPQKKNQAGGYTVDHTSVTLLIGKQGNLKDLLPHGLPSENIVERIRERL